LGTHQRLPPASPQTKCGSFPPRALPRFVGTYEPLRLPLRARPLRRSTAYRVRRSQSTRRMAPHGSPCWGGDGPLLFPRRLCQRSTPPTPLGSSGLLVQDLHPFRGLRLDTRDSAPSLLLTEPILSTRQASLHAADRWLAPSQRGLDPALRRPGLPERRRATTKVTWFLLWPDLHRLVVVNFRTRCARRLLKPQCRAVVLHLAARSRRSQEAKTQQSSVTPVVHGCTSDPILGPQYADRCVR